MDKILYIGKFVPNQGAAGIHVFNIAESLKEQGVQVCYMAYKDSGSQVIEDRIYDSSITSQLFKTLIKLFDICTGLYEFRMFKYVVSIEHPNVVVLYNETNAITKRIISYCKENRIKVFIENTEWYTLTPLWFGLANFLFTRSVDKRIRVTDRLSDGVIAISSYLEEFYRKSQTRVFNLPPLFSFDVNRVSTKLEYDKIRFVYAGSPGGKDILKPFVNSISKLVSNKDINAEFHIYGINKQQLAKILGCHEDAGNVPGVYAHGRVSHNDVIEAVASSHYTILLRYPARYAKAGYSTKVAESLTLGTPVICNKIGGTDSEITDGKTGFIISDCEEETLVSVIKKVCALPQDIYNTMRKNSIEFANVRYSPETHKNNLYNFIFGR